MNSIIAPLFNKSEFKMCTIPVPKGYPQSLTHCGVALVGDTTFLIASPYPVVSRHPLLEYLRILINKISYGFLGKTVNGEIFENPCIYVGVGCNMPSKFLPIYDNPIEKTPLPIYDLPSYNSDPDLFVENGRFYILNRVVHRKRGERGELSNEIHLFQYQGYLEQHRLKLEEKKLIYTSEKSILSPCFTKYNNVYHYFYIESNSAIDSASFDGIFVTKSNVILADLKDVPFNRIGVSNSKWLPWHMSLFVSKGKLYSLVSCVYKGDPSKKVWLMLGEFDNDVKTLHIYNTPLTDYNSYRSSAYVNDDGVFVLYASTVNEKIKGSSSVDGRDIILTYTSFESLINQLKERE